MTSPIQEIKERLDIVEFIRSYIPLQPAGKNFKALCPFHKEKTPSFIVSPERQIWHCFGCNEGGDVFKFLMKYENLEFYEALKFLAEKTGVELRKISPIEHKQFDILYEINHSAKEFFRKQLEQSKEVLNYLFNRGLKKNTIEEFELGFAPLTRDNIDSLIVYLVKLGYDIKDIERAGLVFKTERGNYVERFRERIIFPIYNHFGKVVGFSGRIFEQARTNADDTQTNAEINKARTNADDTQTNAEKGQILRKSAFGRREAVFAASAAKYINSPETLIFNKSKILYGFHKTKTSILEKKSAILVEGQMDLLMIYQEGIKNVVATSGTALTIDHLKILRRVSEELILCFDSDEAGFKAAERAIDLANNSDFSFKILTFKDFKDPAEIVQKSPGTLVSLIDRAKPAMEFYFERYLKNADLRGIDANKYGPNTDSRGNIFEFKKNIRIILSKIKNLTSAVERHYWLKELALRTKIDEKILAEEMAQLKTQINADSPAKIFGKNLGGQAQINADGLRKSAFSPRESAFSRRELISQRLISLINIKKDFQAQIGEYVNYLPLDYLMIFKNIVEEKKLEDERLINLLNLINLRASLENNYLLDEEKLTEEFYELLYQLKIEYLKERRRELRNLIREAEEIGDEMKINSILKEFNEISNLIHHAKKT